MSLAAPLLENAFVRLRPFSAEEDGPDLHALARRAPQIFAHWSHRGPGDWVGEWIRVIGVKTADRSMIPYTIRHPDTDDFLGVTAFLDAHETYRTVEVGMTCYVPEAQGTAVNPACKRLLMGHAFEHWRARRVQYQIDNRNERSKAAVRKLGARFEGLLRKHKTLPDGYVRDTAFFSIIDTEWPEVKAGLDQRLLAAKRQATA